MISEAFFASCPTAALSRWSLAIADGKGVSITGYFGGVRSRPAMAAPAVTISATGSDMAAQLTGPGRSLKIAPSAVPHEVVREHLRTAPDQARPRLGTECNHGSLARAGPVYHPRQIFMVPLHLKPLQINTRELGCELPAPSDSNLHLCVAECSRVFVGIRKGHNCARWHLHPSRGFGRMDLDGDQTHHCLDLQPEIEDPAVGPILRAKHRLRG